LRVAVWTGDTRDTRPSPVLGRPRALQCNIRGAISRTSDILISTVVNKGIG
jgi:hypothetical protein